MTEQQRLHHLLDRARRGVILPAEGEQLAVLVGEMETAIEQAELDAEQQARHFRTICGERESYRQAWKDEQKRRATAAAEVTRLTAGQCTHAAVPDLRTRGVAALTAAACDGDCGQTEQACQAAHPITRCQAGGVTHIDGPVTTIVDTILAALYEQPSL